MAPVINVWIEDFYDEETEPRRQNDELAKIVGVLRNSKRIYSVERLEEIEGESENGWRLTYQQRA